MSRNLNIASGPPPVVEPRGLGPGEAAIRVMLQLACALSFIALAMTFFQPRASAADSVGPSAAWLSLVLSLVGLAVSCNRGR